MSDGSRSQRPTPKPAVQRQSRGASGSPGKRSRAVQAYSGSRATVEQIAAGASAQVPHRADMESSFGTSFADVRAAVGSEQATAALDASNANAATVGNAILFADSRPSRELVAHELTHTIQQGAVAAPRGDSPVASTEGEAKAIAPQAAAAQPVRVSGNAPPLVPQFDLRDTAREQHEARGADTPAGGGGGAHGSFNDMAEDDTGPTIAHDHGFLDDGSGNIDESRRQDPTWGDRLERLKWIAKLEAAELLRPDLVDGTSAYRHFLFGNGAERDVHYGRFITGDSSGATVLQSAVEDTRQAALERHDQDLATTEPSEGTSSYHIRTEPMSVGSDGRYPYPATENWQKAIGAHRIWIEANVVVTVRRLPDGGAAPPTTPTPAPAPGVSPPPSPAPTTPASPSPSTPSPQAPTPRFTRHFEIEMTIHAEDMYNFNPGAADIATGTPDSANGRFEITGLGQEYLNRGTHEHSFTFDSNMDPVGSPTSTAGPVDPGRSSRPGRTADRRPSPATR